MNFVLDIETIPGNTKIIPQSHKIKAPDNYRDKDKIKEYQKRERKKYVNKAALDPFTGKVVAIGFQWPVGPGNETHVFMHEDEGELLDIFGNFFRSAAKKHEYALPRNTYMLPLVTFRGSYFDLPFLQFRCMLLGKKPMPIEYVNQPPYATKPHCDLYRVLTKNEQLRRWGGGQTLDFFCEALGVEIKDKSGIDGSQVGKAFKNGDWEAVKKHCEADVYKTAELYERIKTMI